MEENSDDKQAIIDGEVIEAMTKTKGWELVNAELVAMNNIAVNGLAYAKDMNEVFSLQGKLQAINQIVSFIRTRIEDKNNIKEQENG